MTSIHQSEGNLWQPSGSLNNLRARAEMLHKIREFFALRNVLEVETPLLSQWATVDRHIDVHSTNDGRFLQTSPEFAMKRLLCAGSGCIWQLAKVFRVDEAGRNHNPEFSMLEWYRLGFDHHALMDEVEQLLRALDLERDAPFERMSYQAAFERYAQINPHRADISQLKVCLTHFEIALPESLDHDTQDNRDFWLDLLMSYVVAPRLGVVSPCFIYDFPASQASLARVSNGLAQRFEVFWRGVELANGFYELTNPQEQQQRFEAEQQYRQQQGRGVPPYDRQLIAALQAGLPDCAGVALGVDRLLMLKLGASRLSQVLSFDWERA